MTNASQQRHFLIVEDAGGSREVPLMRIKYTLGRDPTNDIQVQSQFVSRQHALLLRLPAAELGHYRYRLIDGDLQGHPSANGLVLGEQRVTSHDLQHGDAVVLGRDAKVTYYRVAWQPGGQVRLDDTTLGDSAMSKLAQAQQPEPPLS